MDRAQFRDWFSRIDELTAAQCRKVAAVLSDPPEGEASLAPPLPGGGSAVAGPARRDRRGRRDLRARKPQGRAEPELQATPPRRSGARGRAHPDGHQPPQPDQGLPAALPRHRHQVSRQLFEVVPSRRPRQASIAKSMPRSRQRQDMPAIRELSQSKPTEPRGEEPTGSEEDTNFFRDRGTSRAEQVARQAGEAVGANIKRGQEYIEAGIERIGAGVAGIEETASRRYRQFRSADTEGTTGAQHIVRDPEGFIMSFANLFRDSRTAVPEPRFRDQTTPPPQSEPTATSAPESTGSLSSAFKSAS